MFFNSELLMSQKVKEKGVFLAMYDAKLQIGTNDTHHVNYVLVGGDDFSFSSAESLIEDFSTNYSVDRSKIESNSSYIDDLFYFKNGTYQVVGQYIDHKIGYKEPLEIQWQIENETKVIDNQVCYKATAKKYGRNWIAYFSKEYPFSYGPYKFNGLPGLVFEIYDDKDEYHFTLKYISKEQINLAFNLNSYKFVDKTKYFSTVHDLKYTLAGYPPFEKEFLELRNRMLETMAYLKKMENNPLELDIDD